MLQDAFGQSVLDLLREDAHPVPEMQPSLLPTPLEHGNPFVELLVAAATIIVQGTADLVSNGDEEVYILTAMDNVPELQLCKEALLKRVQYANTAKWLNIEEALQNYFLAILFLRNICGCKLIRPVHRGRIVWLRLLRRSFACRFFCPVWCWNLR